MEILLIRYRDILEEKSPYFDLGVQLEIYLHID